MNLFARVFCLLLVLCVSFCAKGSEEVTVLENVPEDLMLRYFRKQAEKLSGQHCGSESLEDWKARRDALRERIWESLGNFPLENRPPIKAKITGRIDHGDHAVEKVVYESLPGLFVTALCYVPKGLQEPAPAVICVNGHWSEAKSTAIIQQRCMMLAKMGVVAFCQDVIGTGERAAFEGSEPTTYHGFYRGATPRIVDRSLLGYVMYECIRANDYLRAREDVDAERIMCTGASGGGKQSMFFPALDQRLAGGVPVCYVSSYVDHMGATACVGEVPTGVLKYTDQWEILGLHAPRPLLGIAATHDVPVFAPEPMRQTLAKVKQSVYQLYDLENHVQFKEFDSKHDYNKEMRERLYAHVAKHLLGESGRTIIEPEELPVETAETLRCGLPSGSETMRSLTYRRAKELVSGYRLPQNQEQWLEQRAGMLNKIEERILGGFPTRERVAKKKVRELHHDGYREQHWVLETEEGILVPGVLCIPSEANGNSVIIVDEDGKQQALERGLVEKLIADGKTVLAIDYRGVGETAGTVPAIAYGPGTPEYNLSNYALFLGRPLMGMRVHDVQCAIDFFVEHEDVSNKQVALVGRGRGALVALLTAVLDERVDSVVVEELLASWVFAEEYVEVGLSTLIPQILTVGDIEHLAACVAPRKLLVVNPVDGRDRKLEIDALRDMGGFTRSVYELHGGIDQLQLFVGEGEQLMEAIVDGVRGE